ncbi:tRNA (guanosine(46)-N7)-methyltransferase TrmB [Rhodovibrio salinarum]|uniref:tRNA (guanine-N(7)-)-methyltransferase n=1 Tax=Rhodovibrio salinarum TaxID=1087 RepID=A0A934QHA9_9PROT|nr:tRNA (guanosine(46)-N7)-methyltransferase TrmB [Rhodovibrio salinarum]MBK1696789.1 tRNA (guanosine(46)-N7)-methyltransferase TrmB [Rhodovibrio salinarum]
MRQPPPQDDRPHRELHGRHKSRPLRPAQQQVMEALLPRLRVDLPKSGPLDPHALFACDIQEIWLEVGFGAGEHLAWQAAHHPEVGLIGAEHFRDGIARLLRQVDREGLTRNLRVYPDDGRDLLDVLPQASLSRAFVLFPDPWPKRRHHKRRFVQQAQLDQLAYVLADGGELRLATDDPDYQRWMLIELERHGAFDWTAACAADWRRRPDDWPGTRYEQKAIEAGRQPIFLSYRRRPRTA